MKGRSGFEVSEKSKMMNTFVTSWFYIYDDDHLPSDTKTPQWRKEQFINILSTGVFVCIYISPEYYDQIHELTLQYSNLTIMKVMNLNETLAYKCCENKSIYIPKDRSEKKDTFEYLAIINAKFEFIADAAEKNPYQSTHFFWIDFNMTYVFRHLTSSLHFLAYLGSQTYKEGMFAVAGYKGKKFDKAAPMSLLLDQVYWRYCGGFFLLDGKLAASLCDMYYKYLTEFVDEHQHIVWEVNYWAWLETFHHDEWAPTCYDADHNDTIIGVPCRFYAKCLVESAVKFVYDYPPLFHNDEEFLPSSTSYVCFQGKHIINTRFVNYSFCPQHHTYLIRDYHKILHTKNVRSYLDNDTMIPLCYGMMNDETVNLPSTNRYSHGLEDMRLFEYRGKLHFICTNVNYSPNGRNSMMMGEYDPENLRYNHCRILEPPEDTWCEKNWIPIVKGDELFIIYSWSPMKIGKIGDDENEDNKLSIVATFLSKLPYFHKVRGSTTFTEHDGALLGLVHFSDETHPRQYFHMLVRLDRETLEPIGHSDPFCFLHFGIEFCIGFRVEEDNYTFWISKRDNDATVIKVKRKELPIVIR